MVMQTMHFFVKNISDAPNAKFPGLTAKIGEVGDLRTFVGQLWAMVTSY
jgi:hypothetical protein